MRIPPRCIVYFDHNCLTALYPHLNLVPASPSKLPVSMMGVIPSVGTWAKHQQPQIQESWLSLPQQTSAASNSQIEIESHKLFTHSY